MSDNLFNSIFPDEPGTDPASRSAKVPSEADSSAEEAAETAAETVGEAVEAASEVVSETAEVVTETAEAAVEHVTEVAESVVDSAEDAVGKVDEVAAGVIEVADEAAEEIADEAAETVSEAAETVSEAAETAADTVSEEAEEGSPLKRLFGAAAALVDAVIPDGDDGEEKAEAAAEAAAETVPESAPADLAPAAVRSRASVDMLAAQPLPDVEPVKDVKQWDDDLSPELAAVLFAGEKPAADVASHSAAPVMAKPALTAANGAPVVAESVPAAVPSFGPVELTRVEDARRLHLYAGGKSAPAPDTPLSGKVRYMRIEEPYKKDQGQRLVERWQYFKPDYPGLTGRLVREVHSEEITHSDGSWHWRYERRYVDKGRDIREVRANKERTYIERSDEVSVIDPGTGKRSQSKVEARLIFAPPEEEKRGGFLSSLLGKDDDEPAREPVWREASSKEARGARKMGGSAF